MVIPRQLVETFSDVERAEIEHWWTGLSDEARGEVARACDERADACFFGVVSEERDEIVPRVRGGRFLHEDDSWGFDEWGLSYFEHLMEHPELVLVWDGQERTFHLGCTRHEAARACWKEGRVPEKFECPFMRSEACLMRALCGRHIKWRRVR